MPEEFPFKSYWPIFWWGGSLKLPAPAPPETGHRPRESDVNTAPMAAGWDLVSSRPLPNSRKICRLRKTVLTEEEKLVQFYVRWSFFGHIWQRCRISTLLWDLEEHMVSTTAKQITPWTKSSGKEWEKEDESFKSVCKLCIIHACNAQRSYKFRGFNRKAYSWHLTFVKLITTPGVKMKGKNSE